MVKRVITILIISLATPALAGNLIDAGQSIVGLDQPSVSWGDYDKDGDLDLAICGKDINAVPLTKIFINDKGLLVEDKRQKIEGVSYGKIGWSDYDNDGDLDLSLAGYDSSRQPSSKIYRNDQGILTEDKEQHPEIRHGSIAWADSDNDGKQDIYAHAGHDGNWQPYTKVFKKKEDGTVEEIKQNLISIYYGSVGWGDYTKDGKLDLIITGWTPEGGLIKVYKNAEGTLIEDPEQKIPPVFHSSVEWGDYNNDGYLDLVVSGQNGDKVITRVFKNNKGILEEDTTQNLPGVNFCVVSWCDYDQDGDLDLLVGGADEKKTPITRIFNNDQMPPPPIHHLEISGLEKTGIDKRVFTTDNNLVVVAKGCDAEGNVIKHFPVCWELKSDIGTILRQKGITTEVSFSKIGTGTLIAYDQQGHTATVTLKVGAGIIAGVKIEDLEGQEIGSLTLTPDETLALYARSYDEDGNLIGDVFATWTLTGNIGQLSAATGTSCLITPTLIGTGTISIGVAQKYTDTTGVISVVSKLGFAKKSGTQTEKQALTTVIVYPNPVSPPDDWEMWFKGVQQRKIVIRIFNIAGELVRELEDNELKSKIKTEEDGSKSVKWDVKNEDGRIVASGLYIYLIRDIETGEAHTGKLAVAR